MNLLAGYSKAIRLSDEEMREGINRETAIRVAQERVALLVEAQRAYILGLAAAYAIDTESYHLVDWISGFEPIRPYDAGGFGGEGEG